MNSQMLPQEKLFKSLFSSNPTSGHNGHAIRMAAFALCALFLLAAVSLPVSAQSLLFAGLQTTVASGLSAPNSVAVDGAGDVYITDTQNNRILEIPANCTSASCQVVLPTTGLLLPEGVVVDGAGDVFISDTHNNRVAELPAGCTTSSCQTTVGGGFNYPAGLAVDAAGDLFIADYKNNRVEELPAGCTSTSCQTTVPASGLSGAAGVAVDPAGDIFIADYNNNRVVEVPAGCTSGSCQTVVPTNGLLLPAGVALDAVGDLYIADTGNNRIVEIPAGCTTSSCQFTLPTNGLSGPLGLALAVDQAGNVFVADTFNNRVIELQRYSVNFGGVNIGASSSITLTFNVTASVTLASKAAAFTQGAANMDFAPSSASTCAGSLSAGNTCSVTLNFTPQAPGSVLAPFRYEFHGYCAGDHTGDWCGHCARLGLPPWSSSISGWQRLLRHVRRGRCRRQRLCGGHLQPTGS